MVVVDRVVVVIRSAVHLGERIGELGDVVDNVGAIVQVIGEVGDAGHGADSTGRGRGGEGGACLQLVGPHVVVHRQRRLEVPVFQVLLVNR